MPVKSDLIPVKYTHIYFYNKFPLYYISKQGDPVLFKTADQQLDPEMLEKKQYPRFFIKPSDEVLVKKKLMGVLNLNLMEAISSKGVKTIRKCLSTVVEEALEGPVEVAARALPETIEIFFSGAGKNPDLLDALTAIKSRGAKVVEHSVNVLTLTAQYCFYKKLPHEQSKVLGLCALLHDIGVRHLPVRLLETDERLTDKEFKDYKTHTLKGHNDMALYPHMDKAVARTALEHHERLDGSGYPSGRRDLSYEAQVIGLIDSYEPLKYRDKAFRKSLKPYDALQILKADVIKGRYNKEVFVDLCSCLIK